MEKACDGRLSVPTTLHPVSLRARRSLISLSLCLPLPVLAAPGDFDPSFDADGRVLTHFGGFEGAIAVLVQSDGKLVAGGFSNATTPTSNDFALARYNPDGRLDAGFGAGGLVLTAFGGQDFVISLVQQADGKLVAAGGSNVAGDLDFALARYNPDGSLDPSFGSAGRVLSGFGGGEERVEALIQQPDDKLVAAGESRPIDTPDFTLARYNADGSLDPSFGVGGRVITNFIGNSDDVAEELVLQSDGKLVAAGRSNATGRFDVALVRYLPNGSLDASFGSGGFVRTDFTSSTTPLAFVGLALQTDARLVTAAGSDASEDVDFGLARYLLTDEQPPLPPTCGGRPATILGSAGPDTMRGTLGPDVILGLGGNDTVRGLAGNDSLCGGPGDDRLIGGDGKDRLLGASGNDRLFGDADRDRLDGGTGRDRCRGGPGRDAAIGCEGREPRRPPDPPPPPPNPCPIISNIPCGLE